MATCNPITNAAPRDTTASRQALGYQVDLLYLQIPLLKRRHLHILKVETRDVVLHQIAPVAI